MDYHRAFKEGSLLILSYAGLLYDYIGQLFTSEVSLDMIYVD